MSEPVDHTDRGFSIWTRFKDTYGNDVRVQTSSAAFKDRVWIFINGIGGQDPDNDGAAHLSPNQARELAGALLSWAEGKDDEGEGVVVQIEEEVYTYPSDSDWRLRLGFSQLPDHAKPPSLRVTTTSREALLRRYRDIQRSEGLTIEAERGIAVAQGNAWREYVQACHEEGVEPESMDSPDLHW